MLTRKFSATSAIVARTAVKFTTNATVEPATSATDRIIGIYMGVADAVTSDEVEILMFGPSLAVAGGSVGRGARLTVDANSKLVHAVSGDAIIAMAMASASLDDLFEVIVIPSQF